jgi:hypothetical protein
MQYLETIVTATKHQIQVSATYLNDPISHANLYEYCFKPDIHHIVQNNRLFNLVPKPSFIKKHVKINNSTMKAILGTAELLEYRSQQLENTLTDVLDIKKVKRENNGMVFGGYITTDGFSASIPFQKPVQQQRLPTLEPCDFEPWGVNSIFVATNGSSDDVYHERK